MPRALRWIVALAIALALTRLATFGIGEALTPQEVKNWEAGKPVWYRPLPASVIENDLQLIEREKERREIEANYPPGFGNAIMGVVADFIGSMLDPIALVILALFTFVILRLLPRQPSKAVLEGIAHEPPGASN
jgi:hypothetical protein